MDKLSLIDIRAQFPIFTNNPDCIYLDSAATTHKPQTVIDAMSHFYVQHYGTVHRAVYDLSLDATARYNEVRLQLQRFLNAKDPAEIIFTRGTTEAINLVARCASKVYLHPGDEVLISALEHHANIVPWQQVCSERGCSLKVIPVLSDGTLDLTAYDQLLSNKTKIVAIAHIANSIGTVNPIAEMIDLAHHHGALVLIDGAQSAAHSPIDVQALDADFYAFSGHKIYGPTGVGVLYGKKHLLDAMPPFLFGGDMVDVVSWETTTFQPSPLKFEAGTPMIAEVIGLGAALEFIESFGRDWIAEYEAHLTQIAWDALKEIPEVLTFGPERSRGAIIGFVVAGVHHLDLGTMLNARGIAARTGTLCAQPVMKHYGISGMVRISFGIYNTSEDVVQFISALKHVISILR